MRKKVIDIYAPHAKTQEYGEEIFDEHTPKGLPKRSILSGKKQRFLVFFVAIFAIFPLLTVHMLFSKITVETWPEITKFEVSESIIASVRAENVELDRQIIRAQRFEQEKVLSGVFSATGRKEKDAKARGFIRVYNENSSSQTLVINTRFISEDGDLFRTQEKVVIPASSSQDVEVVAAESGEDYNIGPANFSLPGLVGSPLYTKIHGESSAPMHGGAAREVAQVKAQDIAAAKEKLAAQGFQEAKEALAKGIPEGFILMKDSFTSSVVGDDSLVQEGAELDRFNYQIKVRVAAIGYHEGDLTILANHLLESSVESKQVINKDTFVFSVKNLPFAKERIPESFELNLKVSANVYREFDVNTFARDIRGVSSSELDELMREYPYLAKAQFSFWPFWVRQAPDAFERVHVQLVLE
jgi:hypothetical protein